MARIQAGTTLGASMGLWDRPSPSHQHPQESAEGFDHNLEPPCSMRTADNPRGEASGINLTHGTRCFSKGFMTFSSFTHQYQDKYTEKRGSSISSHTFENSAARTVYMGGWWEGKNQKLRGEARNTGILAGTRENLEIIE